MYNQILSVQLESEEKQNVIHGIWHVFPAKGLQQWLAHCLDELLVNLQTLPSDAAVGVSTHRRNSTKRFDRSGDGRAEAQVPNVI